MVLLIAVFVAGMGCSKEFKHQGLGMDSPQAAEVKQLLDGLRKGGQSGLDETIRQRGASGMNPQQAQVLRASLMELVTADKVELVRVDEFGDKIIRGTFKLDTAGKESTVAFLLVQEDDGLRWAGRN